MGQLATTAAVAGASTEEGHVVAPSPMASKADKKDLHEIQQVSCSCTCPPHCFMMRAARLVLKGRVPMSMAILWSHQAVFGP